MTDKEMNERLDEICRETRRASTLNALHACRPGHPFNRDAKVPFYNAWFSALHDRNIACRHIGWLHKQAEYRGEIAKFSEMLKPATAAA